MVKIEHPSYGLLLAPMNDYQLEVYDLFHEYDSISITIPSEYKEYSFITALAYMYRKQRVFIISPSNFSACELKYEFNRVTNSNKNVSVKFYGLNGLRNFTVNDADIVIVLSYNHCTLSTAHKKLLNELSHSKNIKLMLLSTYEYIKSNKRLNDYLPTDCKEVKI